MSMARVVLRNLAASWVGMGSQLLVTFFLTPFVIAQLGLEAYGVWLLLQSTVGYYSLVDMGLRAGLTQSITRRIAQRDWPGVRDHLGAAVPLLACLGVVVLGMGGLVAYFLPRIVTMGSEVSGYLWLVVAAQVLSVSIQMPLAPFSAILVGLQRYDLVNIISVCTRLLSASLSVLALSMHMGLVGLSLALLASNVVDSCVRVIIARGLLPEIGSITFSMRKSELRELSHASVWNLLIHFSRQWIYFSDIFIVGFLYSAAAVAPFGVAASLVEHGNRLVIISTRILFPTMAKLRYEQDQAGLRALYATATRITLATSVCMIFVGGAWIAPFLRLWLGNGPEQQEINATAPGVFWALGLSFLFVSLQRTGMQLWLAANQLRSLAMALIAEAVLNFFLSLWLGWQMGVVGVAIGTAIPSALLCLTVHLPKHAQLLAWPIRQLVPAVLVRPVLYAACLGTGLVLLKSWWGEPTTWPSLLLAGGASTALAIVSGSILLERAQMNWCFVRFAKPLQGIWRRLAVDEG